MFLTSSLLGDFITLFITILVILIAYWKWCYQYWSRRNVPSLPTQGPFGNFRKAILVQEHVSLSLKKLYDEMKSKGWKHGGIYICNRPSYFPIDLDIVRNIMTKDFQYFMDRDSFTNAKKPLHAHLLNLSGDRWKNLRAKLTPTFTSGKMKMMFGIMEECQHDLQKRIEKECENKDPIDIKEVVACFTTNIIGSCAFGLEFKALEDEDSAFRNIGRRMFEFSKLKIFLRILLPVYPEIGRLLNIAGTGNNEQTSFIMNLVKDTIDYREKNNYTRNDFMQLLINLKNKVQEDGDHDGKPLTFDEVASQALVFFAAGFETSSTLMTFALYQLAKNQDIQDKLREEIKNVLEQHDNKMTYDSIQDIKYLSQVVDETLRMHPPAAFLNRKCVKDYKVPNTDLVIEKGVTVRISTLGIHYDPDIYPNPEKFDPERFNDDNRKKRHNYAHLPFGEGPRNCIGMRFGLLQSKVGLVSLLQNFKFTLSEKTREPILYKPTCPVLAVEGEVWLNAQKI